MIKTQYPYIDEKGIIHDDEIKFYSDKGFKIIQRETGEVFDSAINLYPSKYGYDETDIPLEQDLLTIQ